MHCAERHCIKINQIDERVLLNFGAYVLNNYNYNCINMIININLDDWNGSK